MNGGVTFLKGEGEKGATKILAESPGEVQNPRRTVGFWGVFLWGGGRQKEPSQRKKKRTRVPPVWVASIPDGETNQTGY